MTNAADRTEVADRARGERDRRKQEAADLRFVLSTKEGRRVVWKLLERGGIFRLSFNRDPYQTAFNEGNRNLAQMILTEIQDHCAEKFMTMLNENRARPRDDESPAANGEENG